jgi:hypothetical protein
MTGSFLGDPPVSPQVQALYDEDLAGGGYVSNGSRLWAHQPDTRKVLFELMSQAFRPSGLTFRQRGILVTAAASALGDSYRSLAWGGKLGKAADAAIAAGVLNGSDAGLTNAAGTAEPPRASSSDFPEPGSPSTSSTRPWPCCVPSSRPRTVSNAAPPPAVNLGQTRHPPNRSAVMRNCV